MIFRKKRGQIALYNDLIIDNVVIDQMNHTEFLVVSVDQQMLLTQACIKWYNDICYIVWLLKFPATRYGCYIIYVLYCISCKH